MFKKYKEIIDYCGLNYKNELIKFILINFLGFLAVGVSYYFYRDMKISLSILAVPVSLDYMILSSYSSRKSKLNDDRDKEFVTVISYFEIFVTNKNNVYQSFNKVIPYCSEWMQESISTMLRRIDEDKTVKPYVEFASLFRNNITSNIMLSIYSMVDQGESFEQVNNFQVLFEQLQKQSQLELVEKKKRSLSILASLPLVGAGAITVSLTMSIISIIGELVNVI